jgi:hypothetical protein
MERAESGRGGLNEISGGAINATVITRNAQAEDAQKDSIRHA